MGKVLDFFKGVFGRKHNSGSDIEVGDIITVTQCSDIVRAGGISRDALSSMVGKEFIVTKVEEGDPTPYWYHVRETGFIFPSYIAELVRKGAR